jgi:hypothetical protein
MTRKRIEVLYVDSPEIMSSTVTKDMTIEFNGGGWCSINDFNAEDKTQGLVVEVYRKLDPEVEKDRELIEKQHGNDTTVEYDLVVPADEISKTNDIIQIVIGNTFWRCRWLKSVIVSNDNSTHTGTRVECEFVRRVEEIKRIFVGMDSW